MRLGEFVVCLALTYASASTQAAHGQEPQPSSWTPPKTTVAKELVEVGQFMLKHGMADPRGGKLGIATVTMSTSWSQEAMKVKKLGWIKDEGSKKTIVDMAGIAYPVKSEVEDVRAADAVDEVLKLEAKGKIHYAGALSRLTSFVMAGNAKEDSRFSELLSDQAVILLLIHGEKPLAERLFAKRSHFDFKDGKEFYTPGLGDYTEFSTLSAFLSNFWVEAVHAHMRGDDALALSMAKTLVDNADDYEKYGATLKTGQVFRPDENTGKTLMFDFLSPAPVLAKDSARRIKEGPKKVDLASLAKLPKQQRIAKLIGWLDQVRATQWGQPGGVTIERDPIVQALIKEGSAAGDALLDCMEKDTRLTRSVSFGRDFFPGRNLITVKSAAFAAFCGITQVDAYGINMRREPTVAELRRMWARSKSQTPAERWLSVLSDSKSSYQQWVAAAGWLAEPKDIVHTGGWVTTPKMVNGKPVNKARFTDLPAAKIAKLANLLESRAKQIEEGNTENSSMRLYNHEMAIDIAVGLFAVDRKRAIPLMKDLLRRAQTDPIGRRGSGMTHNMNNAVYRAYGCLIIAKHPKAEEDYVQFVKACDSESFGNSRMLGHLTKMDPVKANRYAKSILTAKGSGYNIEENIKKNNVFAVGDLLRSPMPLFPSFRSMYIGLMSRKEVVGKVELQKDHKAVSIQGNSGWQTGSQIDDQTSLSEIAKAKCRLCDLFAFELANRQGAPKFRIYWSEARKNVAIKALCAYLRDHYEDVVKDARMMYQF